MLVVLKGARGPRVPMIVFMHNLLHETVASGDIRAFNRMEQLAENIVHGLVRRKHGSGIQQYLPQGAVRASRFLDAARGHLLNNMHGLGWGFPAQEVLLELGTDGRVHGLGKPLLLEDIDRMRMVLVEKYLIGRIKSNERYESRIS